MSEVKSHMGLPLMLVNAGKCVAVIGLSLFAAVVLLILAAIVEMKIFMHIVVFVSAALLAAAIWLPKDRKKITAKWAMGIFVTGMIIAAYVNYDIGVNLDRVHTDDAAIYETIKGKLAESCQRDPYRHVIGLHFKENAADDVVVERLQNLTRLRYLQLNGNPRVTDKSIPFLLNMKGLNELDISGTGITQEGVKKLMQEIGDHCAVRRR